MKKYIIILSIIVFILLVLISVLIIQQMEQKIIKDCKEQGFKGIKSYWDADVNCSQIKYLFNRIKS